jgi:hypothetical protein
MYESSKEQIKKYYAVIERKKEVIRNVEKLEQGYTPNNDIQKIKKTVYIQKNKEPEGKRIENIIDDDESADLLKGLFSDL